MHSDHELSTLQNPVLRKAAGGGDGAQVDNEVHVGLVVHGAEVRDVVARGVGVRGAGGRGAGGQGDPGDRAGGDGDQEGIPGRGGHEGRTGAAVAFWKKLNVKIR